MTRTQSPKHFLLTTWEGGGSVAPAMTVARKLVARGHRVRIMSDACNLAEAEAAGADFVPWTRAPSRPDRTPASDKIRDWAHEGPDGFVQVISEIWAGPALAYARDVMAELAREPADLVVTSEFLFGVAVGCEAARQPFCYLPANVSFFPMPGAPPVGQGLAPPRDAAEAAMQAEMAQAMADLFDCGLAPVNEARAALGLRPLARLLDITAAAKATLLCAARAFDFAPDRLPPGVRYVGPQLDEPAWVDGWSSPWPADDDRPLVLVSFSTTFQNHAASLQRIIDAAAELPVRVLVTLGGSISADALVPAANCRLVDSAPHDVVMREAALVVDHGGHGTVMRALAHQRPQLVVPHGRDQHDNAVRVTARGAGLSLLPTAAIEEFREALARLLNEPAFAVAARVLGKAVAAEAASPTVVEALEDLVEHGAHAEPCPA